MSDDNDEDDLTHRVVSIDDFKPSAVKRMLVEALRREAIRTLPAHRRSKAAETIMGVEDDENDASKENDKKVDLVAETKGAPRDIPVTKEDVSRVARDSLTNKQKLPEAKADDNNNARVRRIKKNPKLRQQKKGK